MSSATTPPTGPPKRGSASARRVLHGVGRPLRRVSRGLFRNQRTSRSSNGSNNPAPHHDYGSMQEDGSSSLNVDRLSIARGGGAYSDPSIVSLRHSRMPGGSRGSVDGVGSHQSRGGDDRDWVVYGLEVILLRVLVVLGAFCLGAYHPHWLAWVWRCMEYVAVAWVTCMVIIVASHVQGRLVDHQRQPVLEEEEVIPLLADESPRQLVPPETFADAEYDKSLDIDAEAAMEDTVPPQVHPELDHFFVMDATSGERIYPNNPLEPSRIDNELFEGHMLLMFRTPDVDDTSAPLGTEENSLVSDYFSTKKRLFEFQYQIKLKKIPEGRIYFSCEVQEHISMGMIQRAFVGAAMSFVKKMNNGFHFALNTSPKNPEGKYEVPHISFTVEGSMDRLVVSKPGDTPPKLGQVIEEDAESIKKRKKGTSKVDWNTQDTYTFAMWSAYCDFLAYRVLLPGVRPFYMSSVTGDQHTNLTLYTIPPTIKTEKHYKKDMMTVVDLEVSNTRQTALGPCAKAWTAKNKQKQSRPIDDAVIDLAEEEQPLLVQKSFSQDEDDEEEEEDQDWVTVEELGEGMYLRSGDNVVLKESLGDGDPGLDGGFGYLNMAGGFAVLQNQASSTIVIEKARRSRARSKLIKSGDTVMIKLLSQTRTGETETKYLSVHRGWWLKWVSIAPTKNGYFTVYTHETEFDLEDGKPQLSSETQTSYLTLNGTFWLRHKRWSKYQVGVSLEESATYGGRVLGLLRQGSLAYGDESAPNPQPEDEEEAAGDTQEEPVDGKEKTKWMKPLYFVSQEVSASSSSAAPRASVLIKPPKSPRGTSGSSFEQVDTFIESIDVPAWVEMMHRTERRPGLRYVVRVMEEGCDDDPGEATIRCYLRTGRDVAEIIRAFQSRDKTKVTGDAFVEPIVPKERRSQASAGKEEKLPDDLKGSISSEIDFVDASSSHAENEPIRKDVVSSQDNGSAESLLRFPSLEGQVSADVSFDESDPDTDDQLGSELESVESGDDLSGEESGEELTNQETTLSYDSPGRPKKGRKKFMGKIAKSMKAGTSATGKKVVKSGKKVGKGTVTAGKAIISPISRGGVRPKKPPLGEPKSKVKSTKSRGSRRRKARDHHVAVRKAVKSIERRRRNKWLSQPPSVLAGQLCAPDQSCRTASHVLSKIASLHSLSPSTDKFNKILSRQLGSPSDVDKWFLQGGAIDLGVVPPKTDMIHESLVARCLWESHWREEWCGIYATGVMFFAPLKKKASLDLSFVDVQSVRRIDPVHGSSPLPGFPILAIETAWRCHYMAFSGEEAREHFWNKINEAIFLSANEDVHAGIDKPKVKPSREKDLWKARFWQGFQSSVESSLSGGNGKWAKISSSSKMVNRTILNGRRMVFDMDPLSVNDENEGSEMKSIGGFVEDLLSKSLTFSLDCLEDDPDLFVQFLDATSLLRSFSLDSIDLASDEAFCIFANLYHCLLQHALLLSVNGPCTKRSVGQFMRCTCYEIGGDIFSLAELQCCVLRGKMSRPVSPKAPYVEAPKKSNTYRFYALGFLDPKINFLLNSADCACPQAVPVLTPENFEDELKISTQIFIQNQLSIDLQKKQILLPKVCDVYRNDFGSGEAKHCLLYCLQYLNASDQELVVGLLRDDNSHSVVKYQHSCDKFHLFLTRRESITTNDHSPSLSVSDKSSEIQDS